MATATLSSGAQIPLLGFGTWKIPNESAPEVVKEAIRTGYRHIDCASDYANEKEVGEGIRAAIEELGVKREELWITSKLWNSNHRKEHVKWACEASLKDLGLDYLDLYLIHFPISFKWREERSGIPKDEETGETLFDSVPLVETWRAMEELVDCGLVKNIGVSNFNSQLLGDLLTYARIPPVVNQVEVHPLLSQERLLRYCQSVNVHVSAFSPLGSVSYAAFGGLAKATVSPVDRDEVKDIAKKHGCSPGQVVLAWGLSRGCSVLVKSANPTRLKDNYESPSVRLDPEEMETINKMNCNLRFNDPVSFFGIDIHC